MAYPTSSGKRAAGFTLIELLVVLAIVSVLLTLAVPRYFSSIEGSKTAVLSENLQRVRDAIDKFYGDTGRYPANLDEMVEKHYLRSLPVDPVTDRNDSWTLLPPDPERGSGIYDIKSGAEGATADGRAYSSL
ncbi:prepilin-type N-terminal cleavage/methylation domain-containing protein [Chitinimonas arctica]|uniref:Prepilin-type N-terminal cleavage/methylation domain-containing protein n=1 Tax=Chitinimonas arctica TaxID=2594795 RepID=A0A516SBS8_9NEIS|nr:prepilin-type N-terminal cleavage/methylation domain-containing protein [Chitinimonas arctica]QDQ25602.1 prepilin-type N-terminal cleavage/methylation domain-containing protein [Chitinimonas arctica]